MMRLALLPDFAEENWPSMDLCAESLQRQLPASERLTPRFRRVCSRMPILGGRKAAFNGDRLLNRFIFYPRYAKRRRDRFDFFHIVDHTYAQLVHVLPAERAGVFCHDLDAFRCLLEPARDRRPKWFRMLSRRILSGLQKAAIVFHSTAAMRDEIVRHGLIDPGRLVLAPYGVSPEFSLVGPSETDLGRYLLHVGSNAPRKRIDTLLRVLAGLRQQIPNLRLLKVGPPFTAGQQTMIGEYKLADAIVRREGLARTEIAALYRGAAALLLPSEAEGFGLPLIEALACGAPVVAGDLPALREVGGTAAEYAPVGDVEAWIAAVKRAMDQPRDLAAQSARSRQAEQFDWHSHARVIHDAYLRLSNRRGLPA